MSASWRIGGALLLAGCSGANAGNSDPQNCAPVETPAASVSADGLGGEYTLRLVATAGAKRGSTTAGKLSLMQQDSAYRSMETADGLKDTSFTMPFYGMTEVDLRLGRRGRAGRSQGLRADRPRRAGDRRARGG